MKIAIGIDTGGTYTDAVMYDFETKKILGTAKALTTKEDLCIGISAALDGLSEEYFPQVRMLSLSTTLATNACVEEKGGRAKLFFFGGDEDILRKYGSQYGLPLAEEICIEPCKTDISGSIEQMPDWDLFEKDVREYCSGQDGLGVIELYAIKNGAVIEREAKERIAKITDIPVTCGNELFKELNSLQRGAGTLLNAQLYPVIEDFMKAIGRAMQKRKIHAPIVIMRSDGSLMSESFARLHPVETLLCGPAASVVGGFTLTNEKNAVIVDMGGTTTDIAIVEDGLPVRTEDGVRIGKWRTFVNGMLIRTFGLGGDSAVHYHERNLILEEYRVIPLCVAASKFPAMYERLKQLYDSGKICHTAQRHEFFAAGKDIAGDGRYTEQEQKFCAALRKCPMILEDAAAFFGKDVYTLNIKRLIKEGAVQVCGLTPTDLMHVRGDFERFDKRMASLAAEIVAQNLGITKEELCEQVYAEIVHKMYGNVVKIMLAHRDGYFAKNGFGKDTEHMIEESYQVAVGKKQPGIVTAQFHTDFKLIGIGAPIRLFLDRVAELLGTQAVIPVHSEVANALGAVTGNVYASSIVEIKPGFTEEGAGGFTVYAEGEVRTFEELETAEQFARKSARESAERSARERGAAGYIEVSDKSEYHSPEIGFASEDSERSTLFMGVTVTAEAVGSLGLHG